MSNARTGTVKRRQSKRKLPNPRPASKSRSCRVPRPGQKCPECGKQSAVRVIGPGAGIIFKGTGFYQTDYRSDSYKKGAEAAKKDNESSTKSEGGSDAKPAPKSEPKSSD